MFCNQTTILDKSFEMIELEPKPNSEPCPGNVEMKKIMERLITISDKYTDSCILEMKSSECYKRCHSGMASGTDPDCVCRYAGRRNCRYKAAIVAFIYEYTKNTHWLRTWLLGEDDKISIYANNLFNKLFTGFDVFKLPETIVNESCLVYMTIYVDGEKYSVIHSFFMISFENYFIIYDAWGYNREKWVRAMTK